MGEIFSSSCIIAYFFNCATVSCSRNFYFGGKIILARDSLIVILACQYVACYIIANINIPTFTTGKYGGTG